MRARADSVQITGACKSLQEVHALSDGRLTSDGAGCTVQRDNVPRVIVLYSANEIPQGQRFREVWTLHS